uniref:glycosyltransferase family 2 protein n=1 Tax=Petrachloros mirabilis TaxID=2918835 RepID=UPI0030843DBE
MFYSVVIPTYNRQPILAQCLQALENQNFALSYEVIVVDDGSADGTVEWLRSHPLSHVRLYCQTHQGPSAARNLGIAQAQGTLIVFIDSDLVVTGQFLQAHELARQQAQQRLGNDRFFTYGRVINTCNFEHPTAASYKLTDFSAAYFATGNVAIARHWLETVGGFDPDFQGYGWEDLELGVRLKQRGLKQVKVPTAVGYHWHPPFQLSQLPALIDQEKQRSRMGLLFYQKHPTLHVKLMVQMTPLHSLLWGVLTWGGHLNEDSLRPLLAWLIRQGRSQLALEISRVFLNWHYLQAFKATNRHQTPSHPWRNT